MITKTPLIKFLVYSLVFFLFYNCNQKKEIKNIDISSIVNAFEPWRKGFLDIHHLSTGAGDATFFIFPDGTTMLFDAGSLDKKKFEKKYHPLKASSVKPDTSLTAAQNIAAYINNLNSNKNIDYAIVSHFHEDHYGSFVELGKLINYDKIIDRDYPYYNYPFDLKNYLIKDTTFQEYISFLNTSNSRVESLDVGSSSQISLLKDTQEYPTFKVHNVKSNATIWTGKDSETFKYFTKDEMISFYKGKYNENPLSLALKISYGDFDYFTGGDNTGLQGFGLPYWFDVETPMAKAVGQVETITLNHHGNRDATNEFFVKTLNPKVVIQQSWCSDHPGQEVYQRLIYKDKNAEGRDIFATNMHDETLVTYGPWFKDNYKSMQGHIVVRVHPKGMQYEVFILDDATEELTVKDKFGPYYSK